MKPINHLEYLADLDSVEGTILDGSIVSASAWNDEAGELADWLIRFN